MHDLVGVLIEGLAAAIPDTWKQFSIWLAVVVVLIGLYFMFLYPLRHAGLVPASTAPRIHGRLVRGSVDPGTGPG